MKQTGRRLAGFRRREVVQGLLPFQADINPKEYETVKMNPPCSQCQLQFESKNNEICNNCNARSDWSDYQAGLRSTFNTPPGLPVSDRRDRYQIIAELLEYPSESLMWIDLYQNQRLSLVEIRDKIGTSIFMIKKQFQKWGIRMREEKSST